MNKFKNAMWMIGAAAAVTLTGAMFQPATLLAQAVKAALVRSVDEPGRASYIETLTYVVGPQNCTFTGPMSSQADCTVSSSPVPAGKRLVLKAVSSEIDFPVAVSTPFVRSSISTNAVAIPGGPLAGGLTFLGYTPSPDSASLTSNVQTQLGVEAGTSASHRVQTIGAAGIRVWVTLSGYFVDVP